MSTQAKSGAQQIAAGLLVVVGILWLVDAPRRVGIAVITEQYLALVLALTLFGAFCSRPLFPSRRWFDIICGSIVAACWLWMGFKHNAWLLDAARVGPEKWLPATVAIFGLLEAVRRTCGLILALLLLAFLTYGFGSHLIHGPFQGVYSPPERYLMYLYADSNGIPGMVIAVGATQVLGFIVLGSALLMTGGTAIFSDLAMGLMGHRRGGAAKVAIFGSSVMGTISGSTVANVMSTGMVTIPLMKKARFPPSYAAAIEATASNGGQITPPVMGATAFIIAEFLQIPYSEVAIAALLPAVLYYLALYIQVDFYAARRGLVGEPRDSLPSVRATIYRGWPLMLPFMLLIYLLFWMGYSPGRSALYSAAAALCLQWAWQIVRREGLDLAATLRILADAGQTLIPILTICGAAGIIVGTLSMTGVGFSITLQLAQLGEAAGIWPLLLMVAILSIILGLGMPTAGVYIILSVLLAPSLVRLGVEPIAAHLFIFYFGLLSMLTPPVAIASYAAAAIAGSDLWRTGVQAMILASTAYIVPFVFVQNSALLLYGTPMETAAGFTSVLIGCILVGISSGLTRRGIKSAAFVVAGVVIALSSVLAENDSIYPWLCAGLGLAVVAFEAARARTTPVDASPKG